ncbi:toast rack family protein [Cytobacillus sp. IB215665]|uniref:toast rack family protein n=1 Tax=Cytobacillus sp. IB215665 TaxID=3097357 RepID=UPI002A0BF6F8|nr:toast rack family protein [Cytobacillus sp. IB215665]MDX8365470.1 toast rack family protein [Cytobacillus sp. IB215665]
MRKITLVGIVIGTLLIAAFGFSMTTGGTTQRDETIEIKKDQAKELDVNLFFGVGDIRVSEGTNEWVEGNIAYKDEKLKPDVSYDVRRDTGKVEITQSSKTSFFDFNFHIPGKGSFKNEWDLRLSDEVPIDLNVDAGVSDTELDLRGLLLSNLEIDTGVGDMTLDLSGDWENSFDVRINAGIGSTTILLPNEVGVRVHSEKGIGAANFKGLISDGNGIYVNDAFENADVIIDIDTDVGIGEITFEVK